VLKLKFRKLQTTIVKSVKPPNIIDFLYQEDVIGDDDMWTLQKLKDDTRQQCRQLLVMLHSSEHPQAFVHLYTAIKKERYLVWLIKRVDNYTDKSVTDLSQQINISETKGKCFRQKNRFAMLCVNCNKTMQSCRKILPERRHFYCVRRLRQRVTVNRLVIS